MRTMGLLSACIMARPRETVSFGSNRFRSQAPGIQLYFPFRDLARVLSSGGGATCSMGLTSERLCAPPSSRRGLFVQTSLITGGKEIGNFQCLPAQCGSVCDVWLVAVGWNVG